MDKKDYLNSLKDINLRPDKVKIRERNEPQVLMEVPREVQAEPLSEIFVQASEIGAMPKGSKRDAAILRLSIVAELDAVSLYDRFAELASDPKISKVMLDVSKEEKVHAGEFETLLDRVDDEYEDSEDEGEKEVDDLVGKM